MSFEPSYVPCSDSHYYLYTNYHCCSDSACSRMMKQQALCATVYDSRNNTLCYTNYAVSCPC